MSGTASQAKVWSLCNGVTRDQYDGLSFQEARAIIMVLPPEERLNWYGYKSGWQSWKPLKDCVELVTFSGLSRSAVDYIPPPCPIFHQESGSLRESTKTTHQGTFADRDLPGDHEAEEQLDVLGDDYVQSSTFADYDGFGEVDIFANQNHSSIVNGSVERDLDVTATHIIPEATMTEITNSLGGANPEEENSEEQQQALAQLPNESHASSGSDQRGEEFHDDVHQITRRTKFDLSELNSKSEEEVMENMRRFRRYSLRLHVEVIYSSKRFSSFTRDISIGGLALEDTIPDWVAGYCTLIISTPDLSHRLEFMCSVVENQAGDRCRLEIYPSSDSGKLRTWIEKGLPASSSGAA